MEPRDDVDAATGPADATTALQGARVTTEPVPAVTAHVTRVSGHSVTIRDKPFNEPDLACFQRLLISVPYL